MRVCDDFAVEILAPSSWLESEQTEVIYTVLYAEPHGPGDDEKHHFFADRFNDSLKAQALQDIETYHGISRTFLICPKHVLKTVRHYGRLKLIQHVFNVFSHHEIYINYIYKCILTIFNMYFNVFSIFMYYMIDDFQAFRQYEEAKVLFERAAQIRKSDVSVRLSEQRRY